MVFTEDSKNGRVGKGRDQECIFEQHTGYFEMLLDIQVAVLNRWLVVLSLDFRVDGRPGDRNFEISVYRSVFLNLRCTLESAWEFS